MLKSRAVRLLVLLALVGCSVVPALAVKPLSSAPHDQVVPGYEEPDMPAFMQGRIDKAEYMRLREEAIAQKRGLPLTKALSYNPRAKAIRDMETVMRAPAHQLSPDISETSWTEIGPNPIPNGQTTTVSTAVSGRTIAIAVHPTDPNKVYVGTAQGGLYRSLDGGATWTPLTDSLLSLAIGAVAIDPSDTTRVWIGTGESGGSADSFYGVGLYRITNSESVSPTIEGPFNLNTGGADVMTFRSISRIMIHPTVPNTVFVSTFSGVGGLFAVAGAPLPSRGVYRSLNALAADPRFDRLDVPTGSTNVGMIDIALQPGNPDVLVAHASTLCNTVTECGVWRTANANAVAPTFTRTLALSVSVRGEFAVNPAAPLTMLLADGETGAAPCSGTSNAGRLRRSTDGGVTWSAPITAANGFCGGQCFYDIFVAMDPTDATGNKIFLGGAANGTCPRVYTLSTDGGTTFSGAGIRDVGLHADSHAIAVAPSNTLVVYTGGDGGIYKSIDGGLTWASLNNTTFRATQFQSVSYHPTDPNFSIGGTQDNGTEFMMPDGTWTRADFGDGGQSAIDQNAADTTTVTSYHTYFNAAGALMGYARNNLVACYNDGGGSGNWTFHGIYGGAVDPTVYCDGTSDSFTMVITDPVQFYAPLTLGPGNPNTVYFGTNRLHRSADKGDTGAFVSQALAGTITAIAIAPSSDNVRIVGTSGGLIFKTTTGGNPLDDGDALNAVPNQIVNRIAIDPTNADIAYVALNSYGLLAAGQHIWKTTNLSAVNPTWTASGTGIPDVPVNAIVINPGNTNHLYAGTDIGVFNSTDGGATWLPYSTGLPRVAVFDMALQNVAGNRRLRIATHGRGLWERVPITVPVELIDAGVDSAP